MPHIEYQGRELHCALCLEREERARTVPRANTHVDNDQQRQPARVISAEFNEAWNRRTEVEKTS